MFLATLDKDACSKLVRLIPEFINDSRETQVVSNAGKRAEANASQWKRRAIKIIQAS